MYLLLRRAADRLGLQLGGGFPDRLVRRAAAARLHAGRQGRWLDRSLPLHELERLRPGGPGACCMSPPRSSTSSSTATACSAAWAWVRATLSRAGSPPRRRLPTLISRSSSMTVILRTAAWPPPFCRLGRRTDACAGSSRARRRQERDALRQQSRWACRSRGLPARFGRPRSPSTRSSPGPARSPSPSMTGSASARRRWMSSCPRPPGSTCRSSRGIQRDQDGRRRQVRGGQAGHQAAAADVVVPVA